MKPRQIIILLAILSVLVLSLVARQFYQPSKISEQEYTALELDFQPEQIRKIEIGKAGKPFVQMVLENDQWKIPDFWNARADSAKVRNFIHAIRTAQGEVRASGQELFFDFGIDDNQAIDVKLFEGAAEPVLEFRVGSKSADAGTAFIRMENSSDVYLVQSDLLGAMGITGIKSNQTPTVSAWFQLRFIDVDAEKVSRVQISRFKGDKEERIFEIEKYADSQDSAKILWRFPGKTEVPDPAKVERFLFVMSRTEANKIINPQSYDFSKPVWKMTVDREGADPVILTAVSMGEKTEKFAVQASTDSAAFEVSKYYFDELNIEDEKLLPEPPKATAPASAP